MSEKFWGRLGFDNEGIVKEREFTTQAQADAYKQGCEDTMSEAEDSGMENPLSEYWATASHMPSMSEEDAAKLRRKRACNED